MLQANTWKWWWEYFTDHPGVKLRLLEGQTGSGSSVKDKVYCTKCLDWDIGVIQADDDIEVNDGQRQMVCESGVIETHCMYSCTLSNAHLADLSQYGPWNQPIMAVVGFGVFLLQCYATSAIVCYSYPIWLTMWRMTTSAIEVKEARECHLQTAITVVFSWIQIQFRCHCPLPQQVI